LNLPLIPLWVRLLKVPYAILFPLILLFCIIGVYSPNTSFFEINLMIFFGLIGYLMRKMDFEPAPLVFAYLLCPIWEESFRQSLIVSGGDLTVFFKRPISAVLISLAFFFILYSIFSFKKKDHIREALSSRNTV